MKVAAPANPWSSLEIVGEQPALTVSWRDWLGDQFPAFSGALLERAPSPPARFYPCPRRCGCLHKVVIHGDGSVVAVCRCDPWSCDDLALTEDDLLLYRLSWPRLGRALCKALSLQPTIARFDLPGTRQIGAWSAAAFPVMLTLTASAAGIRLVVAELSARLRGPFILLGPSAAGLSAAAQELLANAGARFFPLSEIVTLKPGGAWQPKRLPGELFTQFRPEQEPAVPEDVARRAFALIEQLDSDRRIASPSVLTVFRCYCVEERSIGEIARKFRVSKATVFRRLEWIRVRTGMAARDLRRVSTHLEKIEEDLADARAEHIHRQSLVREESEEEE